MKKLLLVLLVVTLASFLFAGCDIITPAEGEGEAEICPTVSVTSQVEIGGKNYVKGGVQTITVTFAVPTEPVSVYVGNALKTAPSESTEVVVYANADKTVYTGTFTFSTLAGDDCNEAYIYVETCNTCADCKYPYTVDNVGPYATIEICIDECTCAGCELTFTSTTSEVTCDEDTVNCGDACSGLASWSIDIYDASPFNECCLIPCETPIASDSGVGSIDFTTACLTNTADPAYVVVTLVDNVGNTTKMGATLDFNPDTCNAIILTQWPADACVDSPDFVLCDDIAGALGNISGKVKNALTTSGIDGATVTILNTSIPSTTADSSGNYSFSDVPVGTYNVKGSATGYNDDTVSVTVQENQTANKDIILNPTLASGELRIILTWGTTGDLDSHLLNPIDEQLLWTDKSISDAVLDTDNTSGYGPETVTITINPSTDGIYTYAVYDWGLGGGNTITTCGAVVQLYDSNGLVNTYTPPAVVSPSNAWWTVFTITVVGGNVTAVTISDNISSSAPAGFSPS